MNTSFATERRAARERALGLLYEAEAKGTSGAAVLAELPVAPDEFAAGLVLAVDEHRDLIDALLQRFAKDWTLARMPALDRAALRMGTAELIVRLDVPTAVVLAETVELASRFSTDGSGRFVNGLLARVADEVRAASAVVDSGGEPEVLTPQVDALVIDLDGVIRHWDERYIAEAEDRLGVPRGELGAVALTAERIERVHDGRLAFEGWCEEVGAELAARHSIDAKAAADAWYTATWEIDLLVIDLVQEVREVVPVALLSNASTHLLMDLDLCGIGDAFDLVVGSADLGFAKPSREAFAAATDGIGVSLDRALFLDDTLGHVEAARSLGMQAEQFTDVENLRALLQSLSLIR